LNDIIWMFLGSARIPAAKEPSGLIRQDVERPGGLTLIPSEWKIIGFLDVTVASTLAQFYVELMLG